MVVHKWKKEDFPVIGKKVIEAMAQLPEGMALCTSYCDADQTGAWCLWEAKSAEQLEDFLTKMIPDASSDAKPVVQFFPPTPDLYQIMHILVS
jgi:hypothetical protein